VRLTILGFNGQTQTGGSTLPCIWSHSRTQAGRPSPCANNTALHPFQSGKVVLNPFPVPMLFLEPLCVSQPHWPRRLGLALTEKTSFAKKFAPGHEGCVGTLLHCETRRPNDVREKPDRATLDTLLGSSLNMGLNYRPARIGFEKFILCLF